MSVSYTKPTGARLAARFAIARDDGAYLAGSAGEIQTWGTVDSAQTVLDSQRKFNHPEIDPTRHRLVMLFPVAIRRAGDAPVAHEPVPAHANG